MLHFLAFSGLVNGIAASLFGPFVYFKNRHSSVNKSYALLSLSVAIWGYAYYFWPLAGTKEQALLSFQILHMGAVLIAPSFLWFVFSLLDLHKKLKGTIILFYVVSAFFIIVIPTTLFIKDMVPMYIFHFWAVPGIAYHFYLIFWSGCILLAWFYLVKYYRKFSGIKRNQLKYVLIASLIGFLGGVTNYLPWYKIYIPPIGTILVTVHIIILAYAIVHYRLMDIRLTITRTGVFVVVYTLVLGLPFLVVSLDRGWLTGLFGDSWWVVPLVLMAVLATVGPFVYIFLQKKAEAIFLSEQQKYQRTLKKLSVEITRIHSLKKLLDLITNVFVNTVKVAHFSCYLFDRSSACFLLKSDYNLKEGRPSLISGGNALIEWLRQEKEIVVYEEIKRKYQEMPDSIFGELMKQLQVLGTSILIPCFFEDELMIIINLGDKLSKRAYTSQDLDVFSVLAGQVALAVEDASLYEHMEDEVRQRTKELVGVQKQLIQTEKLATVGTLAGGVAHEINNPLTAILTNIQMLLASGDTPDRESLELIEEATQRCRNIVKKLMVYAHKPKEDVSFEKIDVLFLVNNVIAFLKYQLEQENIKVNIDAKGDSFNIQGNRNELEQVLTNLILNGRDAIRRNDKPGIITVVLDRTENRLRIKIRDNGCGIAQDVIPKVFDPFFTTKDVGKGLGLGLSICQAIIEKHKGDISVKSELGKGSEFVIALPAKV